MNRARFAANGRHAVRAVAVVVAVGTILAVGPRLAGQIARTGWTVVAWNNLGMHCMDADFSAFAILPPYNTIQAQVLDASGHLVKTGSGITVTYEAVADATGSINKTSKGKTNFWQYVESLFGAMLQPDQGLVPVASPFKVQQSMPGPENTPQPMQFDPAFNWFIAEGIPITPYDDAGRKNYYPMMRVTARNGSTVLASTDIVLPVSDEMDCRACHASGSGPAARPAAGWVNDTSSVQRDFRLNILRLHDEKNGTTLYPRASANPPTPVLCASCHASEALGGGGNGTISPLTAAIHRLHGGVIDPTNGQTLGSSTNRTACYRCHPGSETRCLRGVMGNAVAATVENGTYSAALAIQCQNCHGSMSAVGAPPPGGPCDPATIKPPCPAPTRTGWFDEPTCQSCHTGTATSNAGQIRYTSVFEAAPEKIGATFATSANTPAAGVSLYRFSSGHGGLQCSACHGSTHAEYASSHGNDNKQSLSLQGHVGTIAECGTCHTVGVPMTGSGGPHGMHPVGAWWVDKHHDYINGNLAQCQACHGTDYRGTELSRAFAVRTFTTELGTKRVFRGATVGCYMCHNGPFSSSATSNHPPVVSNVSAAVTSSAAVTIPLLATDGDNNSLTFRIVSQPANGAVALPDATKAAAVYKPAAGWSGTETFTYTANDGWTDSESIGTVTVTVTAPTACTVTATAAAPSSGTVGVAVQFTGTVTQSGTCSGGVSYTWHFGDGAASTSTVQNPPHTYNAAGNYTWTFTASVGGATSAAQTGTIAISATPQASGPAIISIQQVSDPFGIRINGSNFQSGVRVYIGADQTPWSNVTRSSDGTQLTLSGGGLRSKFPKGQAVAIKVVNPDGQWVTRTFTRQ